jgi:nucleoside-diphosphate kinase
VPGGRGNQRFEQKGLHLCGLKMMQLDDAILSEHYAHLSAKPFFQRVKDSMMTAPVIAMCLEGVDAIAACASWPV